MMVLLTLFTNYSFMEKFSVQITLVDNTMEMPKYHTEGAVAFDLYARERTIIPSGTFALIPNNVIVEIPKGYALGIFSRSSTPRKKGLMIGNAVGVIDQDYHGPEDEIMTCVYNVTDEDVIVEKGERISQAMFIRVGLPELVQRDTTLKDESRGGFGSTG